MFERVYIHNFRCFENFSLDFTSRPSTLIIGKNGSGKSTFRHALGLFRKIGLGVGRVRDLVSVADFTQQRTQVPMRFEAELLLGGERLKYVLAVEHRAGSETLHVAEESLHVDGAVNFARDGSKLRFGEDVVFELDSETAALSMFAGGPKAAVASVRAYFSSMALISPIPSRMSGYSESEDRYMEEDGANFSSRLGFLLARRPSAYSLLSEYLKEVMPDFASFENEPRGETGRQLVVNFEHEDSNRRFSIPFGQLSDGEKCFFLCAHVVAWNKAAAPLFCMWDEPDKHLSLPEVGHFITQLRKMTHRGGQFVATSHHPEAIRRFSDESTLVFSRKSHLEPTVVRPLSEIGYAGDLVEALSRDEVTG